MDNPYPRHVESIQPSAANRFAKIGYGALVLGPLLVAILQPVTSGPYRGLPRSEDIRRHKRMALSLLMYQTDNNSTFPPSIHWMATTQPYATGFDALVCTGLKIKRTPKAVPGTSGPALRYTGDFGHAMNGFLGGERSLAEPELTVLTFCSARLNWNANDPLITCIARFDDKLNVSFADGHTKWVTLKEAASLRKIP